MEAKLGLFSTSKDPWIERLDLVAEPYVSPEDTDEVQEDDKVHDDFKRELYL